MAMLPRSTRPNYNTYITSTYHQLCSAFKLNVYINHLAHFKIDAHHHRIFEFYNFLDNLFLHCSSNSKNEGENSGPQFNCYCLNLKLLVRLPVIISPYFLLLPLHSPSLPMELTLYSLYIYHSFPDCFYSRISYRLGPYWLKWSNGLSNFFLQNVKIYFPSPFRHFIETEQHGIQPKRSTIIKLLEFSCFVAKSLNGRKDVPTI